jgi:hypothetical protein
MFLNVHFSIFYNILLPILIFLKIDPIIGDAGYNAVKGSECPQ